MTFDEKLKTMDLMEIKEKLDAREKDMYKHGYQLDSEGVDFHCKEICLFNMLVHKEIGIPYESQYQYGEPYEDC